MDIKDILKNLQERKDDNSEAVSSISSISDKQLRDLDNKIGWHSMVSNYAIWILFILIFALASLCLSGYLRLEDKLDNQSDSVIKELEADRKFNSQRLDDFQKSLTQRMDEEHKNNTQRLDNFLFSSTSAKNNGSKNK